MLRSRLSPVQLAALDAVGNGAVRLTCINGTVAAGPVALNTLWSLEERGLVVVNAKSARARLTPFGKQIVELRR